MMDDLQMMQNPDKWPQWPYLPVKRWVKDRQTPDLAIMSVTGESASKPIVYFKNMFDSKALIRTKHLEYASFEELLNDGWVVD